MEEDLQPSIVCKDCKRKMNYFLEGFCQDCWLKQLLMEIYEKRKTDSSVPIPPDLQKDWHAMLSEMKFKEQLAALEEVKTDDDHHSTKAEPTERDENERERDLDV